MTANTVNGSGNGARSGAQTLELLAVPLNCSLLLALSEGRKQQSELRREAGSPAQTTLRAQLKKLVGIGAIAKHPRGGFPGGVEYELTAAGQDLLSVTATLERWLEAAPDGPLGLGSNAAKAAIRALAEGWSTTMLRALAAGPFSLTELDGVIGSLSYPSLERRLGAMRLAGQIEARRSNGRSTPYAVTAWLRQGVAPLTAASRWERTHLPLGTSPITRLDIEAIFLLAVPLSRLPNELSGSCRLAVEVSNREAQQLAGAMVGIEQGKVSSCATRLSGNPDSWVLGAPNAWFNAVIDRDTDRLELGGERDLARALLDALHGALFSTEAPTHP